MRKTFEIRRVAALLGFALFKALRASASQARQRSTGRPLILGPSISYPSSFCAFCGYAAINAFHRSPFTFHLSQSPCLCGLRDPVVNCLFHLRKSASISPRRNFGAAVVCLPFAPLRFCVRFSFWCLHSKNRSVSNSFPGSTA